MSFGQPQWFWALAVLPVLAVLFLRGEQQRTKLVGKLVAARLFERLAGTVSPAKRRVRFVALLLGLACVAVALARPQWGYTFEQSKRKGRDVLIAIDTSRSMLATDLAPNRLTRAKLAAQDLIQQLQGDRVGLIAFAGGAFLQAPLTVDYGAVLGALNELDTDIIPQGGTDIAAALKVATEAFGKGESDNRALIIFTDGEDLEAEGEKAAGEMAHLAKIFTVGLGSPEGSLIPLPGSRGGDFVKDPDGQIVKSRLDETRLEAIARAGGGFYERLDNGRTVATRLIQEGLGAMAEQEIDAKLSRRLIERYQWPLGLGLVFLAVSMLIGERRRPTGVKRTAVVGTQTATVSALLLALLLPTSAHANWFKNSGVSAYQNEDFKGAADTFSKQLGQQPKSAALQYDLGSAAYKAGDYDKALGAFSQALTSSDPALRTKAEYNLANTLFQRGAAQKETKPKIQEWKNALQHYEQALKSEPGHENAQFNRDLVTKLIADLEKEQEKKDQDKKDQDKKDDKKDDKDDKDKKDDKKQDQKDQQKKDQDKEDQKKDGDKDSKDQQGDKKDDKDGQKDPKDGKDGDQKKDQPGKDGKPGDDKKQQPGTDKKDGKGDEKGQEPKPDGSEKQPPAEPGKKPEGELKSGNGQPDKPNDAEQQQAAEEQAAAEGKMTDQQARNLLESLKSDDRKVQLLQKQRPNNGRPMRDW